MHFVGGADYGNAVSPDYYGWFTENLQRMIGVSSGGHPFVAMMSQGTSGDLMWRDYSQPKKEMDPQRYADALSAIARTAYRGINYRDWVPIDMCESRLKISRRVPTPQRLMWGKQLLERVGNVPRNKEEVYAREQLLLAESEPVRELKLQAIRVGDLGITGIPNEVFGITGLKIKAQSPLRPTFNIGLANGAEGYIPPPEQHKLGGYTTWLARSASLEADAEPRILESVLSLLETVAGRRRNAITDVHGSYAKAILAAKPLAYWRCNEFGGPAAQDATGNGHRAFFEDGIAFYLEGPQSPAFSGGQVNRAPHFAGGRMRAALPIPGECYSVEMWFYSGMPVDAQPITGYLVEIAGDKLAIGGTEQAQGRLLFARNNLRLEGTKPVPAKTWNHLVLVREKSRATVYLNGQLTPDVAGMIPPVSPSSELFIGGQSDRGQSFEGKIDEVAIFQRALRLDEIATHYRLATE
jgi:hypothetical protein